MISRNGVNFDPTNQENYSLRGAAMAGANTAIWNGTANSGAYFPTGTYSMRATIQGGEFHFPLINVENNTMGGPVIRFVNPPNGTCPPVVSGFYDDRGYTTHGQNVGTPGTVLCGGNPPNPAFSDPVTGFDTTTANRRFGFDTGGNYNDATCVRDPNDEMAASATRRRSTRVDPLRAIHSMRPSRSSRRASSSKRPRSVAPGLSRTPSAPAPGRQHCP